VSLSRPRFGTGIFLEKYHSLFFRKRGEFEISGALILGGFVPFGSPRNFAPRKAFVGRATGIVKFEEKRWENSQERQLFSIENFNFVQFSEGGSSLKVSFSERTFVRLAKLGLRSEDFGISFDYSY